MQLLFVMIHRITRMVGEMLKIIIPFWNYTEFIIY